jgi:hypothetical protein
MKCYTINESECFAGISVTESERGNHVFLGEEGRGRHYERVALHKSNPPQQVERVIFDAHPVKISLPANESKPAKEFYVLASPKNSQDPRVLVRVNCYGTYTKGSNGTYEWDEQSKGYTLVTAFGAWGIAGRVGTWADDLLMLSPGDLVRIKPSGGYKVSSYILKLLEDGELIFEKEQDYLNALAQDMGIEEPL